MHIRTLWVERFWIMQKVLKQFLWNYRIMDYCRGKSTLNFEIDAAENGQLAAVLDFWYNIWLIEEPPSKHQ